MKKISIKLISITLILTIIFTFFQTFFIKNEVNAALSNSYTQYIENGIASFPESYQRKLAYLKYLHPNWEFKAYYTGIDWNELTSSSAENKCMKNTIHKGNLLDPTVLCICGRSGDPGYYCASAKTVNYYLDPRNFMGEAMIFQFLDLANSTGITKDIVAKTVNDTYLASYVDDIMKAASESGISPIHIVATIFQELGKTGVPKAISGTVEGYEGLYNFYNYGATDGDGAVERGLEKARELGWTTPTIALVDGAKRVLANNYVSVGQTTKYFYKFDVVGNEILTENVGKKTYSISQFYSHQYMTNLRDPSSQAGTLYDIYADNGILDVKLTFTIPVYNNMPSKVEIPTSLTIDDGELYYIDSLKKWGVTLRTGPGTSYTSLGNLYKDTVVALIGQQGLWSKIKINKTTGYDNENQVWKYETQEGYILTEYLTKIGTDVPDYRQQIGLNIENINDGKIKIENNKIIVAPTLAKKDIINKFPDAIVKRLNGTIEDNSDAMLGTGMVIIINNSTYTCVKSGDVNSDGVIKASDYVLIKNYIMNSAENYLNENQIKAADVNHDGSVKASDYVLIKNHIMEGTEINI